MPAGGGAHSGIEWTGVSEFVARLQRIGERASIEARAGVVEVVSEVERLAKQNASGRPGPNVVTGTLRRGIAQTPATPWGLMGWQAKIRPTVIYSRRIELGFHGADSRGRHYDQPAYPYFTPAWNTVAPRVQAIWRAHMIAAISSV